MKKRYKFLAAALCVLTLSASLAACGNTKNDSTATASATDDKVKAIDSSIDIDMNDVEGSLDLDNAYTVTLNGTSATTDAKGVEIDGSEVKITSGGVYRVSGSLSDGQLKVKTDNDNESVVLALDGVDITNKSGAAIHIKNALSAYIVALSGTTNTLTDTANYEFAADDTDGEPDATIFSKEDLVIGGKGSLTVNANYSAAVKGKDNLYITDTALTVTSVDDGIKGRDSLSILGGEITIKTADGAAQTTKQNFGRWGNQQTSSDTTSAKGIKATNAITISGGTIDINGADDALHSNGDLTVSGGELTLASSDDGMHADSDLTIAGGKIDITRSYEGIEAQTITISDGDIKVRASDDGINAAGGNDSSQQGGFGGDPFSSDNSAMISVTGGAIYLNADGDGFDSNGAAQMSGGTLYVDGPTDSGNGALDFGSEFVVTGGTLVAAGASGMAEKPADSSTQTTIQVELGSQSAGSTLTVTNSTGNEILSYSPAKAYQNVVISTPQLKQGETYTVYVNGAEVTSIETTSVVTSQGGSTMGGGMGGRGNMGGMGGNQPDGNMGGMNGNQPGGGMGGRQ